MGVALQRAGKNAEAVAAYQQGLALDPNWPEAHLNQAYALQDSGRYSYSWGWVQRLRLVGSSYRQLRLVGSSLLR
jgi:Flp pilus assembly protein TadD